MTDNKPNTAPAYFFIRLIPPRPTFMLDMSANERQAMLEHVGYWRKLLEDGIAVGFGPVADPDGGYGIGIVELADPTTLPEIEANDPAIRGALGMRYEIRPMPQAMVRPHHANSKL